MANSYWIKEDPDYSLENFTYHVFINNYAILLLQMLCVCLCVCMCVSLIITLFCLVLLLLDLIQIMTKYNCIKIKSKYFGVMEWIMICSLLVIIMSLPYCCSTYSRGFSYNWSIWCWYTSRGYIYWSTVYCYYQ